jgi:hypothetical protein
MTISGSSRFLHLWLLPVLAGMMLLGCRAKKQAPEPSSESGAVFIDVAAEVGLRFEHFTGATGEFYLAEIMGPGVAVLDYDGDGDLDVYVVQASVLEPGKSVEDSIFPPPKQHWPGNRLFRNELIPSGKLSFKDVTDTAGVREEGYGLGVAVGDYDDDGDPDLYVTNYGPNVLYCNNGDGTFTDVTGEAGVEAGSFSSSAAFVDYDRDGDLDLYVAHYNTFTPKGNKRCRAPSGERDYCSPTTYFPLPDRLYQNQGRGRFREVTRQAGIGKAFGHGLGVICADFSSDGWVDIYVANDMTPNQLWMNRRNGTFDDVGLMSGSAYNADGKVEAGMGVSAEDFDGDGDMDIFVSHLRGQTNTLYLNDGSGNFDDATALVGLGHTSLPFTGFGIRWFDYDNDGLLDIFVANGLVMMDQGSRGEAFPYHQKNQLFHNEGGTFRDVTDTSGSVFELSEVSRGAAFGDIDNDGDTDIVVANCNGPVRLLLNQVGSRHHWLQVRLEAVSVNRDGYGAQVALLRRGRAPLWRRASTDGSYLSAHDSRVQFGLGSDAELQEAPLEAVMVEWPNGEKERWTGIEPDRLINLKEGTGTPAE